MTASLLNKEGRALAPATKEITVSVVQRGGRILLLRRREDKQFDPGRWEFVSGFVKSAGSLQEQARAQVVFETGLQPRLEKEGAAFEVHDEYGAWKIHPFLFSDDDADAGVEGGAKAGAAALLAPPTCFAERAKRPEARRKEREAEELTAGLRGSAERILHRPAQVRLRPEDHTEFRWVRPDGLARFDCVKELERNLKSLGL